MSSPDGFEEYLLENFERVAAEIDAERRARAEELVRMGPIRLARYALELEAELRRRELLEALRLLA